MGKRLFWFIILVFTLTGCASPVEEDPRLIASYPGEKPIAVYPSSHPNAIVVYNATVNLEVSNVDTTAEKAESLAYRYGGYLASSQSWFQEDEKYIALVLAVPVSQFEEVHQALLRFGSLVSEYVTGELRTNGDAWGAFSYITVNLHPKKSLLPSITWPDWRPTRTFAKAWDVFIAIFGFLVDIVIWVAVVAGPFVLIGWGIKKFIKWKSQK